MADQMTTSEFIDTTLWEDEAALDKLSEATSFKTLVPAVYRVTPLKIIETKNGARLILKLDNVTCPGDTLEAFAPSAYGPRLRDLCGGYGFIHNMKYRGMKELPNNRFKYDFVLGQLKGNPITIVCLPSSQQIPTIVTKTDDFSAAV